MVNISSKTNAKLKFPVKTDLKIILDNSLSEDDARCSIYSICEQLMIACNGFSVKSSSGGKFNSYTINVIFKNREEMNDLYRDLGLLPGLKMVL